MMFISVYVIIAPHKTLAYAYLKYKENENIKHFQKQIYIITRFLYFV